MSTANTTIDPNEKEPLADAQERAATPETLVIGTDAADPLEQLPGETFEAYVERTAPLLDDRPETIDRILEKVNEQIEGIDKTSAVEAGKEAELMSGALTRIGTGPSEGSQELAATQAELDRLVAEGREDLKGLQADAKGIATAPVAGAVPAPTTGEPNAPETVVVAEPIVSASAPSETSAASDALDLDESGVDASAVELAAAGAVTAATIESAQASSPANNEQEPGKAVDQQRIIASVEGDPTAPHTPEEVNRVYQEAVGTVDQVFDLAIQTDRAGLGDVLPSATAMHEWLPTDSPLRLPASERQHLTPEQAVRAEVDAYGIVLRAMVELDLSELQTSTDSEAAAASLEALAATFDLANTMRERLPKAAHGALVDAMSDAAAHSTDAPGDFASDSLLFSWADRTHKQTTTILRSRAQKIRTGDAPPEESLVGMPDAESAPKAPDLSKERARLTNVMGVLDRVQRERHERRHNVVLPVAPGEIATRLRTLPEADDKAIAELAKFLGDVSRRPLPNEGARISDTSENLKEIVRAINELSNLEQQLPTSARESFGKAVPDWSQTKAWLDGKKNKLTRKAQIIEGYSG